MLNEVAIFFAEKLAERDKATCKALEERFPNYDQEIWGSLGPPGSPMGRGGIFLTVQRKMNAQPNNNSSNTIIIRLRDQAGEETIFKVKRTTKMGKVFDLYAARKEVSIKSLRFMFGERINPSSTPEQLDLEDHDQIDCFLAQTGC